MKSRPSIDTLASHLSNVFPALDESGQELALALYRMLSQGAAVSAATLASKLGLVTERVVEQLTAWPGVYYDDARRVIGFWGLTTVPMRHRLLIDGRELYAWCAWDTLFLPELLGTTAHVESACRGSEEPIRLTVTPHGSQAVSPRETVVSFLSPDARAVNENVVTSFCYFVHFFRSPDAALPWLAERPKSFLISLADAYELGRRVNHRRYGMARMSNV